VGGAGVARESLSSRSSRATQTFRFHSPRAAGRFDGELCAKRWGVGRHFDSYDVFLLQGSGHRRWQISAQADRSLIEGATLRILRDFRVEQE
jgi:hypothetical protein